MIVLLIMLAWVVLALVNVYICGWAGANGALAGDGRDPIVLGILFAPVFFVFVVVVAAGMWAFKQGASKGRRSHGS